MLKKDSPQKSTDKKPVRSSAMDEDRISGKIYDWPLLRRLLKYGFPYWYLIVSAVIMIIAAAGLDIVGPYITKIAVDRYILPKDYEGLIRVVTIYVGILVGSFAIKYFQILLTQYIGQRIIFNLRQEIFSHLQSLHQQFFDKNPVGRLMTRVTSDVEALNQMFTQGIVMIFGDLFLIIGIVVMMVSLDVQLALWTFSVIPLLFFISFLFRKKVRYSYSQIRYYLAKINSYLQEHISGMSVVQLFNREKKDFEDFKRINWEHTGAFIKTIFYYALFYPGVELVSAIALAIIIFRGGWLINSTTVTLGVLIAFIQYAKMFFRPISDLSEKYNILQGALASSERIFKLLDTDPTIKSPAQSSGGSAIRGDIEFRNVWFAYNSDFVLKDLSFSIEAGKRYALVGHTGAGKTSIIRLIGRFYDIQQGTITIDGKELDRWDLHSLRQQMAIVLQDVFLFSGTVLENIRLGRKDISESEVINAAKMVNAHRFIEKLPGGYNAVVRERGSNFSMGQKQLLSLARALVINPSILLLDEATSNIDSESEALIKQALEIVLENRTAIVIAHRLSTIQNMDKILVLHKGILKEQGAHQELLKQRGFYYKLYQLQFQERTPNSLGKRIKSRALET
jgi:ATP-binding cassette subfamily B multidrug efflux pump